MIRDAGYGAKLVREYNELNILRLIKNEGPLSRADLAKRYKISKAAVSEIIAHLLQKGYISEIGMGSSTVLGGRKPILLQFNPKSGYAVGIEIKRDHARVSLGDLNANLYDNQIINFTTGAPLKFILNNIFEIIDAYLTKRWVKNAKPIGIGVAIPGLINYKTGKIQESDSLKNWEGFPIKENFEKRYNIETIIENDVKAISLGEYRFGRGENVNNVIYLWIGDGIGAGIIINGELYRGVSASAGEIGYNELDFFVHDHDEFKLLYEDQRNFRDILSEKVLINAAKKGIAENYLTKMTLENLTAEVILNFAEDNDPLALELLREYGKIIGILCINLINTINPELILIGGDNLARSKTLLKFIKDKIKKDILRTPTKAVRVKNAILKENAGVLGCIGLVLEDLFYMERLNIAKYRDVFRSPDRNKTKLIN